MKQRRVVLTEGDRRIMEYLNVCFESAMLEDQIAELSIIRLLSGIAAGLVNSDDMSKMLGGPT